ncbi:LamB/YcsF family protein [Lysobacter sp. GX 14042]|uniref:5-oxoprolinase subunit PxpA n=1 Tax=Lysobacter sp. GX 14042 TaxID=2907155 RepID=UPI001F4179F4|nr:5-oxoprolinase subunit PxpA [Lysobacter sp. GX 14042]MCE7031624.1 LamB/YcsF family protein [Lysobacter sp. GX 14042]
MRPAIDFNCDLGEGCGNDAAIIPLLSSANIACGGHAGDGNTMRATLRLCREHGVAAGAHPGYEDPTHFGRRELDLPPTAIAALVTRQLARLARLADEEGIPLVHLKPHGALYNQAARSRPIAEAIATAVAGFDRGLMLVGLSGSELPAAGEAAGLRVAHEVFAERGYGADCRLLPRGAPGAVLGSLDAVTAQALGLARHGGVRTVGGGWLDLRADTLCLHGDRGDAPAIAAALRRALQEDGITIRPLS